MTRSTPASIETERKRIWKDGGTVTLSHFWGSWRKRACGSKSRRSPGSRSRRPWERRICRWESGPTWSTPARSSPRAGLCTSSPRPAWHHRGCRRAGAGHLRQHPQVHQVSPYQQLRRDPGDARGSFPWDAAPAASVADIMDQPGHRSSPPGTRSNNVLALAAFTKEL